MELESTTKKKNHAQAHVHASIYALTELGSLLPVKRRTWVMGTNSQRHAHPCTREQRVIEGKQRQHTHTHTHEFCASSSRDRK
jgi:hypothetical protein